MGKKKFLGGKNNNAYIVFYSAVMVIIVAIALSFTKESLKDLQQANILNEKKDAIVAALRPEKGTFDSIIDAYVVNEKGEKVNTIKNKNGVDVSYGEEGWQSAIFEQLNDLTKAYDNNILLVFENKNTGEIVIPITGKGLWGDIWGYFALKADMNTVKGVIFDHANETPGLGAEIATPKYQAQFTAKPKMIYNENGEFVSIAVVKGGGQAENPHAVDAVTGGTKTSEGLAAMINDCLKKYDAFFKGRTGNVAAEANCTECADNAEEKCPEAACGGCTGNVVVNE